MKYKRITYEDRFVIELRLSDGVSQQQIDDEWCRDKRTISRELIRGSNLMNILNNHYPMSQIDLLQVDVEGFDYEVLKMIDF
jgi:IS30 family transposase